MVIKRSNTFAHRTSPWRRRVLALLEERGSMVTADCVAILIQRFPAQTKEAVTCNTIKSVICNMGCQNFIESDQPLSTPPAARIWSLTEDGRDELNRLRTQEVGEKNELVE